MSTQAASEALRQDVEALQVRKKADLLLLEIHEDSSIEDLDRITRVLTRTRGLADAELIMLVEKKREQVRSRKKAERKQKRLAEEAAAEDKKAVAEEARRESEKEVKFPHVHAVPEYVQRDIDRDYEDKVNHIRQMNMQRREGFAMEALLEEEEEEGEASEVAWSKATPWWNLPGSPWLKLACELPRELPASAGTMFLAHHILIVDNSGSMRTADVRVAGTSVPQQRVQAVKNVLLTNFLQTQIQSGATPNDRVSLIKLEAGTSSMPFALFPLESALAARMQIALNTEPGGHGPYLPALDSLILLCELAAPFLAQFAETQVLFLTDGKPSDQVDPCELPGILQAKLQAVCAKCPTLKVSLLGFGEADSRVLQQMKDALPAGTTTFEVISNHVSTLTKSVSTFSASVSSTRISSVVAHRGPPRELRRTGRSINERRDTYCGCEVYLPPSKLGDFRAPLRPLSGKHDIEISTRLFGYGGERNAYEAGFLNNTNFTNLLEEWVVKESRFKMTSEEQRSFHKKALVCLTLPPPPPPSHLAC